MLSGLLMAGSVCVGFEEVSSSLPDMNVEQPDIANKPMIASRHRTMTEVILMFVIAGMGETSVLAKE